MPEVGEQGDFMVKFIASHSIPRETIDYFNSIPWTHKYLADDAYKPVPTFSRVLKPTGEDYFFSRTIATSQTIPHMATLMLHDFQTLPETPPGQKVSPFKTSPKEIIKVPEKPDLILLASLARPGLDGHPHLIHGGVSCAILDESLGLCMMLHHQHVSGPRDSLFTVSLNVTYRAPVPTPSDIVVRCWLVARQGVKWFSVGQIIDKDGKVLVEGEGIWVLAKRQNKI